MSATDSYQYAAKLYGRLVDPMLAVLRQIGLRLCQPAEGTSVVDIGCGTGAQLQLYQRAGCSICGIDSSAAMLERAREMLGGDAELQLADATRLPFDDEIFDLATLTMVVHAMDPPIRQAALSEAKRVVKQGGRLLITEFHPGPISFPKGWYYKALAHGIEFLAGPWHFRNFRRFIRAGGVPALAAEQKLAVDAKKIVGAGNYGVFLLRR